MSNEDFLPLVVKLLEDESLSHELINLLKTTAVKLQEGTMGSWREVYRKSSVHPKRVNYPKGRGQVAQLLLVAYHADDLKVGKVEARVWDGLRADSGDLLDQIAFCSTSYNATIDRAIEYWNEVETRWQEIVKEFETQAPGYKQPD